jgi:hypothetical protein
LTTKSTLPAAALAGDKPLITNRVRAALSACTKRGADFLNCRGTPTALARLPFGRNYW